MSEFFIVVSRPVQEFDTLPEALVHQRDLQRHVPDAEHRVFRCKRYLAEAKHFAKAVELLVDIQRDGLTDGNRERLRILLGTIGTRTPRLQTLIKVDGPPEYEVRR